MGTAKTCLLFFTINLIYAISAQEMKRVPDGFVGTRGKKSLLDDTNLDHFYKRKPQYFAGDKGNKYFVDRLAEEYFKRAPMGFVGMRGKKQSGYNSLIPRLDSSLGNENIQNDATYATNDVAEYLQALEKENVLGNILKMEQLLNSKSVTDESDDNDIDKRAANVRQFYGVRGKKFIQKNQPYDMSFRGKFIGVRGKKDINGNNAIKFLLDQEGPWPKRKTQMGFFGMRGKKWSDESSPEIAMDVFY